MYVIAYDVGTTELKSCLFDLSKDSGIRLIDGEMADYDRHYRHVGCSDLHP